MEEMIGFCGAVTIALSRCPAGEAEEQLPFRLSQPAELCDVTTQSIRKHTVYDSEGGSRE